MEGDHAMRSFARCHRQSAVDRQRNRSAVRVGIGLVIATVALLWGVRVLRRPVQWQNVPVVVQPGDTLWTLCDRLNDPAADIRECVYRAKGLHGGSTLLHAGETVGIPIQEVLR